MTRKTRRVSEPRQILSFWVTIICVSLVLGGGAFAVGKYLVGGMVKKSGIDTGAPELVVQTEEKPGTQTEIPAEPPEKAQARLDQRAPTAAEKAELDSGAPQDGAQLNQDTATVNAADDSLGDDDKPVAAKPADQPDQAPVKGSYTVVAGSFADPTNADKEVSRLTGKGYTPYIVKVKREGKTFHRVCVGSFGNQEEAANLRDKLRQDGAQASLVRD